MKTPDISTMESITVNIAEAKPIVSVRNVHKTYPGGVWRL